METLLTAVSVFAAGPVEEYSPIARCIVRQYRNDDSRTGLYTLHGTETPNGGKSHFRGVSPGEAFPSC